MLTIPIQKENNLFNMANQMNNFKEILDNLNSRNLRVCGKEIADCDFFLKRRGIRHCKSLIITRATDFHRNVCALLGIHLTNKYNLCWQILCIPDSFHEFFLKMCLMWVEKFTSKLNHNSFKSLACCSPWSKKLYVFSFSFQV